jgi:protoporphyrinogen oxidase
MSSRSSKTLILGAGMTGLAAGCASGLPVFEAQDSPGGICSSYYMQPGESARLSSPPSKGEAYRFELGGGHWIFGGDALVLQFIGSLAPLKSYSRLSSVFLPDRELFVPYPLQNNLKYFQAELIEKALSEMAVGAARNHTQHKTMESWLEASFGRTLCDIFFFPFHELYTAGLWKSIAPQDSYKSPVDISLAVEGAFNHVRPVGYNTRFVYPEHGLNALAQRMASQCDIRYGKRVERIDVSEREVHFSDGSGCTYDRLLSTLPLNRMIKMCGIAVDGTPDPSPSVLVVNLGARRGNQCPKDHWVYVPASNCGFHRVGFYSHVDSAFLPKSKQAANEYVSIYVEKAYPEGVKPNVNEISNLCCQVVKQLQEWRWITDAEVVDPTWIDVAYTWSLPGSTWKQRALKALEAENIHQVGRYARWVFQGIADSIRDGLLAGASARQSNGLFPLAQSV